MKNDRVPPSADLRRLIGNGKVADLGRAPDVTPVIKSETFVSFGVAWFDDVDDVAPALRIRLDSGDEKGPPAVSFSGPDGVMRTYVLGHGALDMFRAAVVRDDAVATRAALEAHLTAPTEPEL